MNRNPWLLMTTSSRPKSLHTMSLKIHATPSKVTSSFVEVSLIHFHRQFTMTMMASYPWLDSSCMIRSIEMCCHIIWGILFGASFPLGFSGNVFDCWHWLHPSTYACIFPCILWLLVRLCPGFIGTERYCVFYPEVFNDLLNVCGLWEGDCSVLPISLNSHVFNAIP